jgi:hypothetical protein
MRHCRAGTLPFWKLDYRTPIAGKDLRRMM